MPYYECSNDKRLLEALQITISKKEHVGGKGNVCNSLKIGNNLKGLVDEDPNSNKPSYYKKLIKINSNHNINIYSDSKHNNTLVELSPDLENWIINLFKIHKINFQQNDLPEDADKFKILSKTQKAKVKEIIESLINCSELQTLKQYL